MEFNEALAKDDSLRNASGDVSDVYGIPLDTLLIFAKMWFHKGQFDARLDVLDARLAEHVNDHY